MRTLQYIKINHTEKRLSKNKCSPVTFFIYMTLLFLVGTVLTPTLVSAQATDSDDAAVGRLTDLYSKNKTFEIYDARINSKVIDRFLIVINKDQIYDYAIEEREWEFGKKRCTRWNRNGRRFCVQRLGFLQWKFGTEHRPTS